MLSRWSWDAKAGKEIPTLSDWLPHILYCLNAVKNACLAALYNGKRTW
jgi:hypothetical protein